MATQATESLAVADSLPAIDNTNSTINHTLNRNLTGTAAITSIHTDIEDKRISTPESSNSGGVLSQEITKDGKHLLVTWTKDEERRIVRKVDFILLPLFSLMFTWMAIDRTNVSGVLTSTFLADTGMTRDQANTGVSLLWFGIVLLEIPSNIILHRIGPHYWIPAQVVVWGMIEVLQMFVRNASSWYAARLFLGLAESGFIPGGLYTLSRWYTKDEITKRTTIFFFGPSISAAFGSLISAGALSISDKHGLNGWQWIFVICGVSTIATGLIAFTLLPSSPHHTGHLLGGLVKTRGWLTDREADVFVARLLYSDPLARQATTMKITIRDLTDVLFNWTTWPYLIVCLSGLQSVGGLSTWGATIIQSLGFSSVRANLLNAPAPLLASIFGVLLASVVDRTKRFGYAIIFVAVWTLVGLIALFLLPVTSKASWSFYAAYLVTQASPSWQPINVTWLSLNMKTPQQRAIAYAIYIGCSNLGGTYGNQVFRGNDAPLYRKAWAACLALGAVWLSVVVFQTIAFRISSRRFSQKARVDSGLDDQILYYDIQDRPQRYYW